MAQTLSPVPTPTLKGFYRVQPTQPGFAIPVFVRQGVMTVQQVSDDEIVDGFLPIDIDSAHLVPIPEKMEVQAFAHCVGSAPLHAFQRVDGTVAAGTRKEIRIALLAELHRLSDRPFLLTEVTLFLLN